MSEHKKDCSKSYYALVQTLCQPQDIERSVAIVPRLRDSTPPMTRLLLGYQVNGANLASVLRCAPKTARAKIADPERLTLGDLKAIHNAYGVPVGEIRERVLL